MLQNIRDNSQGVIAWFIVGLITIVFAMFGVESLFLSNSDQAVVKVNGEKITEYDIRRAMEIRRNQYNQMFGGQNTSFLTDEFLRKEAVESMIQRRVLESAAIENKLGVSDRSLDKMIVEQNVFQLEGRFDPAYYRSVLNQAGFTPASYREQLRRDVMVQHLQNAFANSSFITEKQLRQFGRIQFQRRSFEYITLPLSRFLEDMEVSEEEIGAYYEENQDKFLSEEEVTAQYIELRKEDFLPAIELLEEDVRAQYEAEVAEMEQGTERRAAHILVEEQDDNSHEKALQEITQRLASGEEFAVLAKEFSADVGSAQEGGDVGFTGGESFVSEFEEALAELEVGAVSEPVKTQFGYHVIKLLEVQEKTPPTYEESRERIEALLKEQFAEEMFVEKQDQLQDLSYTASDLSDVAVELTDANLEVLVQTSSSVSRAAAEGVLANPQVLSAAFSEDVLSGNTSEVIELSPGHSVVLKVTNHVPATVRDLVAVRDEIIEVVKKDKAVLAMNLEARSFVDQVRQGGSLESVAKEAGYDWQVVMDKERNDASVPRDILETVFVMPKPKKASDDPQEKTIMTPFEQKNGDLALIHLKKVHIPSEDKITEEQLTFLRGQLQRTMDNNDSAALLAYLTDTADIVR